MMSSIPGNPGKIHLKHIMHSRAILELHAVAALLGMESVAKTPFAYCPKCKFKFNTNNNKI